MSSPRFKPRARRALACASGVTLFALAPKCLLCLGAYLGVGAFFGLRLGPEICGAPAAFPIGSLLWLTGVTLVTFFLALRNRRRPVFAQASSSA